MPAAPPSTSTRCTALSASGVTRTGADHDAPSLPEKESQPISPAAVWVSHVAYRVPPWSRLKSPSIHQVGRAMEPAGAPTSVRCPDQAVPLAEEAKNSCPGCRAYDGGGLTK